jgi:hypothetical protein
MTYQTEQKEREMEILGEDEAVARRRRGEVQSQVAEPVAGA